MLLRISVIPKKVPCLLSKTVFKTLRCALDLDENVAIFKLFDDPKTEPLYDIPSGHVVIELLKKRTQKSLPKITNESWAACTDGIEVTVNDPALAQRMAKIKPSHGIHKVDYPLHDHVSDDDDIFL